MANIYNVEKFRLVDYTDVYYLWRIPVIGISIPIKITTIRGGQLYGDNGVYDIFHKIAFGFKTGEKKKDTAKQ